MPSFIKVVSNVEYNNAPSSSSKKDNNDNEGGVDAEENVAESTGGNNNVAMAKNDGINDVDGTAAAAGNGDSSNATNDNAPPSSASNGVIATIKSTTNNDNESNSTNNNNTNDNAAADGGGDGGAPSSNSNAINVSILASSSSPPSNIHNQKQHQQQGNENGELNGEESSGDKQQGGNNQKDDDDPKDVLPDSSTVGGGGGTANQTNNNDNDSSASSSTPSKINGAMKKKKKKPSSSPLRTSPRLAKSKTTNNNNTNHPTNQPKSPKSPSSGDAGKSAGEENHTTTTTSAKGNNGGQKVISHSVRAAAAVGGAMSTKQTTNKVIEIIELDSDNDDDDDGKGEDAATGVGVGVAPRPLASGSLQTSTTNSSNNTNTNNKGWTAAARNKSGSVQQQSFTTNTTNDNDNDNSVTRNSRKGMKETYAQEEGGRVVENKTTAAAAAAMKHPQVLPDKYTVVLMELMKKFAKDMSEEEHLKGNKVFHWNILSNDTILRIAQRVPTNINELRQCEQEIGGCNNLNLPNKDTIEKYGQPIIDLVRDFVHEESLERYMPKKKRVGGGGGGSPERSSNESKYDDDDEEDDDVEMGGNDNGNKLANNHGGGGGGCGGGGNTINNAKNASNGSSHQHQNATVGSNVAPAMMNEMSSIPGSDDHQVPSGWVFPRAQTAALQNCLAVIFREFECEDQRSGQFTLDWKAYGKNMGILLSCTVPTSPMELSYLPPAFVQKYGAELLGHIKAFITVKKLERYVNERTPAARASLDGIVTQISPLANNAAAQPASNTANNTGLNKTNLHATGLSHNNSIPPGMRPTAQQSTGGVSRNNQATTNTNAAQPAPAAAPSKHLERWSEYRIDAAETIDDLEFIRRRLLSLVERVDHRLKEKRLAEALAQMVEVEDTGNVEELTTRELMDKLVKRVVEPSQEKDPSIGDSDNQPSKQGKDSSSKRSIDEAAGTEQDNKENKRQCVSSTCPLCFEKIESLSSCGNCEICDESNVCASCYSKCDCCNRVTCSDCLMECDICTSRYHCSDCMDIGDGKCKVCRLLKKPWSKSSQQAATNVRGNAVAKMSSLGRTNGMIGRHMNFSYPPPQSSVQLAASHVSSQRHHLLSMYQQYHPTLAQSVANLAGRASLPTSTAAAASQAQTPAPAQPRLYSVHRFAITEPGTLGLHITLKTKTKTVLVSTVNPDSVAKRHEIKVNDEIFLTRGSTGEGSNIYNLFLAAAKHRPIMFDIKRPFDPTARTNQPYPGLMSLHHFVITESGSLGMSVGVEDHGFSVVKSTTIGSLADIHGLREGDIISKPNVNGAAQSGDYNWFLEQVRSGNRPLVFDVWRLVRTSPAEAQAPLIGANGNPFMFSFPSADDRAQPASSKSAGNAAVSKQDSSRQDPIILLDDDDSSDHSVGPWDCDLCGLEFDEYDKAVKHEKSCKRK